MKRLFLCAFFPAVAVVLGSASAAALTLKPTATVSYDGSPVVQQVHIHGIVPVMRYIYVNAQAKIIEVVGNTDHNITPQVVRADTYQNLPLSAYINDQYQQILADNGGSLTAGVTYYPKAKPQIVQNQQITVTSGVKLLKSIDSLSI